MSVSTLPIKRRHIAQKHVLPSGLGCRRTKHVITQMEQGEQSLNLVPCA